MGDSDAVAPSGTVTFLFSDVVGSTRLWASDADGMAASLRQHDEVFRARATEHDGYVFSTAGDSFAIAFGRATQAASCATAVLDDLRAVDWAGRPPLAVRFGMHLGEAEERDGNYFGPTLNLAARVMAAAHGGQCLVTRAVADVLSSEMRDLGEHRLRDIDTPVRLLQLGSAEFPPLWTATSGIVSLPSPRTSLIGREDDVAAVRRLVAEHRLVTLTGVGGCGKTRLAIEVARREVSAFPQGVWFADLSTVASDDAIYGVLASALEVVVADRAGAIDSLTAYLRPREALLVFDNCEHVIDEAAEFIDHLLTECPQLRIVATSRESLEIDGERAWKVPSLASESGGAAVELFIERALAAGAHELGGVADRAAVADIVEHLDGVPLAIELAAARTRSMSVAEIRDRLDDRFRILSGGKRRSRQRQATLEAAVQWSYDLLDEAEQAALQRLAVFQGGFDPTDVAAVLDVDGATVIDLLDALVSKSLVDVTRDSRGGVRHRLLETIRLFGLSRLVASGEADVVRDRHLDHFVDDRVMRTMSEWLSLDSLWRIDREYENFRAAAEWALERARPAAAAKIGACLSDAAPPRGDVSTVIDWMQLPSEIDGREKVFVQALLAHALNVNGHTDRALEFLASAIELGDAVGCDDAIFARLDVAVAIGFGDLPAQRLLYDEAIGLSKAQFGADYVTCCAAMFLVLNLVSLGQYAELLALIDEHAGQLPDFGYTHIIEAWQAYALLRLGRVDDARTRVTTFSPIPPSSQWAVMNLAVEHVVLAETEGCETALRSFAPKAAESVARRPTLTAELFTVFALIELRAGRPEPATAAADLATAFIGPLGLDLMVERAGLRDGGIDERLQVWTEELERVDLGQRWQNRETMAPGLLADAIARWS